MKCEKCGDTILKKKFMPVGSSRNLREAGQPPLTSRLENQTRSDPNYTFLCYDCLLFTCSCGWSWLDTDYKRNGVQF